MCRVPIHDECSYFFRACSEAKKVRPSVTSRIKYEFYAKNKKLKFWFNEVSVILSNKIRTLVNVEFKDKEARK